MTLACFVLACTINLDWLWDQFETKPFDKQKPFIAACLDPDVHYAAAFCGIQSGKTLAGADAVYALLYGPKPWMLPEHIRGKTPMEVWFLSKSYALCETQLETFRWRTPPWIWANEKQIRAWGMKKGDQYTYWLDPGPRAKMGDTAPIKLRLRTTKDPEGLRSTPVLGIAWDDEYAYWPEKSAQNLEGRKIVARTKHIITTSPRGKNHAYRNVALPGGWPEGKYKDPRYRAFWWTSFDNPYADQDHLKRMQKMLGKEYARQELEGLFTDAIGYVFPEFDRMLHMADIPSDDPNDYDRIGGGIDPGWTDAYAGCVWGRYRDDERWYQLWEYHSTQTTADDVAPHFLQAQNKWGVKQWYTDKRRPSDIARLRKLGVKSVQNIDIYGENDRRTIPVMLAVCQGLMQDDKIRIGRDHEYTAEEFERYHYPEPSEIDPRNTNDNPVDYMNHHMDAMRYCLCAMVDIPQGKNRYRRGPMMTPQEVGTKVKGVSLTVPPEAYIAAQDKKFDDRIALRSARSNREAAHMGRRRLGGRA